MRAVKHIVQRKAKQLFGTDAGYISMVPRGANETPLKQLKSASSKGTTDMTIKKRQATPTKVSKAHKAVATSRKSTTEAPTETMMAKMVFSADEFATEQDVRDYLVKAEWDANTVTIEESSDGGFVARAAGTTDESFVRLEKIETDDAGVVAYVGKREIQKADDTDPEDDDATGDDEGDDEGDDTTDDDGEGDDDAGEDEPTEEAKAAAKGKTKPTNGTDTGDATEAGMSADKTKNKKAAFLAKHREAKTAKQNIRKFSQWAAMYSTDNTLAGTLDDGMEYDSTPPGFQDVLVAFTAAVTNTLSENFEGDVQVSLNKAASDFATMIGGLNQLFEDFIASDPEEMAKEYKPEEIEKLSKWASDCADFIDSGKDVVAKTAKTDKKPVAKAAGAETDQIVQSIAELVTKAVQPLSERVEEVAGSVAQIGARHPTKKATATEGNALDAPKPQTSKKAETADDWMRKKAVKGLL